MALSGSINFLSASLTGSENIVVDFVGLNTLIVDPVSGTLNHLGYPHEGAENSGTLSYFNLNIEPTADASPNQLNSLLLNRNGPYQHPMWKQWRGAEHPISRIQRLNNTMSIDVNDPNPVLREARRRSERAKLEELNFPAVEGKHIENVIKFFKEKDAHIVKLHSVNKLLTSPFVSNLQQYYEPSVTKQHKPFIYSLQNGTIKVRASLLNQMTFFANEAVNNSLKISGPNPNTGSTNYFGNPIDFKKPGQQNYKTLSDAVALGGTNFVYSQTIFPKNINTFRNFKLEKPSYEEVSGVLENGYDRASHRSFWKDAQPALASLIPSDGNSRIRTTDIALNSQEIKQYIYSAKFQHPDASNAKLIRKYKLFNDVLPITSSGAGTVVSNAHSFWNFTYNFIEGGIIVQDGVSTATGSKAMAYIDVDSGASPAGLNGDIFRITDTFGRAVNFEFDSGKTTVEGADIGVDSITGIDDIANQIAGAINHPSVNLEVTASAAIDIGSGDFRIFLVQEVAGSAGNTNVDMDSVTAVSAINFTQGSDVGANGLPTINSPSASFATLESYQPYPIALLSRWPLDPRPDIYDSPAYLTSSIGGRGLQIGLTPHRAKEKRLNVASVAEYGSPVFTSSLSHGAAEPTTSGTFHTATDAYAQLINIQTGSAGELVYSTKPTMFFHKTGSIAGDRNHGEVKGYLHQTASMQYNRHTFPYNTPFYATSKIRGVSPFYDSYAEFSKDIENIGKDFSAIPEYRVSENIEFYFENHFKDRKNEKLYSETAIGSLGKKYYTNEVSEGSKIIKRVFEIQTAPKNTKLNSFKIEGAFVTASADVETLEDATPSPGNFEFVPLTLKTRVGQLHKQEIHYSQNSNSVKFNEAFSHTDDISDFSHITSKIKEFSGVEEVIPSRIKFSVQALKKLLPYENFYPVTKTVDIGNKFKKFIEPNLDKTKTPISGAAVLDKQSGDYDQTPGMLQSFLEPFFAPGILYNSLKSGIAVDYPVYKSTMPIYFCPMIYYSGSINYNSGNIKLPSFLSQQEAGLTLARSEHGGYGGSRQYQANSSQHILNFASSSFNYGGFHMLGASRCIPAILNNEPRVRVPFETIYKTSKINKLFSGESNPLYLTADFIDLDLNRPMESAIGQYPKPDDQNLAHHPGACHTSTGPRGILKKGKEADSKHREIYESSINNFLCETMNFFLADQGVPGVKMPIIVSKPIKGSDVLLTSDKAYHMEVSLEMGKDAVMCEGPRSAGVGGGGLVSNYFANSDLNASYRGYIYGPPVEIVRMSGSATTRGYEFDRVTGIITKKDPLVASFRKSYEHLGDGDVNFAPGAVVVSSFHSDGAPEIETYFGANLQDPAYQAHTPPYFYGKSSRILTVDSDDDITNWKNAFERTKEDSFHLEEYVTGSSKDNSALCRILPGTSSVSGQYGTRMKIDSSVDIFNRVDILDLRGAQSETKFSWYIAPKWVCPVLDFSSSISHVDNYYTSELDNTVKVTKSTVTNNYHDITTGRGLWGGYGSDPYDLFNDNKANPLSEQAKKGLRLKISTPFTEEDAGLEKVLFKGGSAGAGDQGNVTDPEGGYFTKAGLEASSRVSASLGEEFGFTQGTFEEDSFNIGQIASSKEVSEAVVIVPYFERPVTLVSADANKTSLMLPAGELFATREIIPGKHFLPIHKMLFENILSMKLVSDKYVADGLISDQAGATTEYVGFESQQSFDDAKATDVYKMIESLMGSEKENIAGYELPPEFDFINYNVDPFQMLVIPINHTLRKQELIDIYQGVMPESSLKFTKESAFLEVHPNAGAVEDILHSWMPRTNIDLTTAMKGGQSLASLRPQNFFNPRVFMNIGAAYREHCDPAKSDLWIKTPEDFYKNLKFMTFKIKQRAHKDYDRYKSKQIEKAVEATMREGVPPEDQNKLIIQKTMQQSQQKERTAADSFGSNWPYDDFSLVEAVKIDIELEVL